ncbi:MAG TPA: hypothetical protein VFD53_06715 [Ilumatobacter sp.]|nr:hypothetical protein [Ilumatobacter sp.]
MTTTITIHQDDLGDGVMLYELLMDGQVMWSGLGGSPVHGLLRTLGTIAKREHLPGSPDSPVEFLFNG